MYINDFEFGPQYSLKCKCEENFKSSMLSKYKMLVLESRFSKGAVKNRIDLFIDTKVSSVNPQFDFNMIIKSKNFMYNWDNELIMTKPIRDFAQLIKIEYLSCFGEDLHEIDKTNIYIYDFYDYAKSYAYGHSSLEIKNIIQNLYNIDKRYISICHEPVVTIICSDKAKYQRILKNKVNIIKQCFEIIRKYDVYSILTITDIHINALLKSDISKEDLFRYMRE